MDLFEDCAIHPKSFPPWEVCSAHQNLLMLVQSFLSVSTHSESLSSSPRVWYHSELSFPSLYSFLKHFLSYSGLGLVQDDQHDIRNQRDSLPVLSEPKSWAGDESLQHHECKGCDHRAMGNTAPAQMENTSLGLKDKQELEEKVEGKSSRSPSMTNTYSKRITYLNHWFWEPPNSPSLVQLDFWKNTWNCCILFGVPPCLWLCLYINLKRTRGSSRNTWIEIALENLLTCISSFFPFRIPNAILWPIKQSCAKHPLFLRAT